VAPLEHAGLHPLVSLTKRGELLQGRFVGWSAFIPIRGLLQQQLPWPDIELGERERTAPAASPVWDGFGTGPPLPGWGVPRDVMDFFLFLALSDRRAVALPPPPSSIDDRWEVGLLDSSGSALAGSSGLRVAGDPGLLSDLTKLHASWQSARYPALDDWWVTLAPHNVEEGAHGLLVERQHHNEAATLPETVHDG
jgi:hypothetical protein